jgi:hypothetical protein
MIYHKSNFYWSNTKESITNRGDFLIEVYCFYLCFFFFKTLRLAVESMKHQHMERCPLNPETSEEHNKEEKCMITNLALFDITENSIL